VTGRVLLIEDDPRLGEMVQDYLGKAGFHVTIAGKGALGIARQARDTFECIILDLTLPDMDGLDVCRRIGAQAQTPILMLTARGDAMDRVVGLELGADDYIAKPFGPRELVARLRAVLRRANPAAQSEVVVVNEISIDVPGHKVDVDGREIELTGIEFDSLLGLARRAGRVVGRDAIRSEAGRGDVSVGDRTVDVHISHLRQKLGDDPRSPKKIKTIRGVGYVLVKDRS